MPTSVLLAVLAAAGLLALAPALTRRYDATERVAAERATSTARVLSRRRRRRTVPGRRPVNPPSFLTRRAAPVPARSAARRSASSASIASTSLASTSLASTSLASAPLRSASARSASASVRSASARSASARSASARSVAGRSSATPARSAAGPAARRFRAGPGAAQRPATAPRRSRVTALHRRRRVFLALVLLNLVELAGVALVGAGFWIGFSVSFVVLVADLVYLRRRAVHAARARQRRRLRAEWIARQQAAVRREHDRRAAERSAAARRAVAERDRARRDAARSSADYVEHYRAT